MSKKRISYKWPCPVCGKKISHFENDKSRVWASCNHCGWKYDKSPVIGPDGKPITGANGRWLFNVSYTKPGPVSVANSPPPGDESCEVYLHNLSLPSDNESNDETKADGRNLAARLKGWVRKWTS